MTFAERANVAITGETDLEAEFKRRDCVFMRADRWFEDGRQFLVPYRDQYGRPAGLRWMPEYLVRTKLPKVCFVDCKATIRNDTGNLAVEVNALESYKRLEDWARIPVLVVAGDIVFSVYDLENRQDARFSGRGTAGSGTAFVLVNKNYGRPFDVYFGQPSVA